MSFPSVSSASHFALVGCSLHVSRCCCSVGVFKPRKNTPSRGGKKKKTLPRHPLCFRNVHSLPSHVCYCCEVAVAPPSSSLAHNLRVKGRTLSLAPWFGRIRNLFRVKVCLVKRQFHGVRARPLWKHFVPAVGAPMMTIAGGQRERGRGKGGPLNKEMLHWLISSSEKKSFTPLLSLTNYKKMFR